MTEMIEYVIGGLLLILQVSVVAVIAVMLFGLGALVARTQMQLVFFVRQIMAVPRGERRAWVEMQLVSMRRRRGGDDG